MPTLTIGDKSVEVDKSFLTLSPEEQNATVEEIAKSLGVSGGAPKEEQGIGAAFYNSLTKGLPGQLAGGAAAIGNALSQEGSLWDTSGAGESLGGYADQKKDQYAQDYQRPQSVAPSIAEGYRQGGLGSAAEAAAYGVAESLPQSVPGILQGLAFTNPVTATIAGGVNAALIADSLSSEKKSKGLAPTLGPMDALSGAGQLAIDTIPFKGGVVAKALTEGGKEVAQEGLQMGTTAAQGGSYEGQEILDRGIEAGTIGALTKGTLDVPGAAVRSGRAKLQQMGDNAAISKPFAAEDAEIIKTVNEIASDPARMKGDDQIEVLTKNVNAQRNIEIDRVLEAAKALNLKSDAYKSLQKAVKSADGLAQSDWVKLAAKDPKAAELKPMVDRLIRMRTLTQQTPTATGARRLAASVIRAGGAPLGGIIGHTVGGPGGALAGIAMGQTAANKLARAVGGSKTQGDQIAKLVDPKLLARAERVLQKVGPSQATKVMNDLTQRRATQEKQQADQRMEQARVTEVLKAVKEAQKQRAILEKNIKKAQTDQERKAAQDKKQAFDASVKALRLERLRLETEQKATRAQVEAERLKGLQIRNEAAIQAALQKAQRATERAEKAKAASEKAGNTAKGPKLREDAFNKAKYAASGIDKPIPREEVMRMLGEERTKIDQKISQEPDDGFKNLLIDLRDALDNAKNDTEKRVAIYEAALKKAGSRRMELKELFNRFATYNFVRQRTSE